MTISKTMIDGERPAMPTDEDENRAQRQLARYQILMEDWEQLLYDWMKVRVDETRLQAWGAPDTAVNTLAFICRALTTPGLYGARPKVTHIDPFATPLTGPGQLMDGAGYWTMMQWVQYLCFGMGDMAVQPGTAHGGLTYRPVLPFNVWMDPDPEQLDRPVRLWELRLRHRSELNRWVYAWDQWDLGEPSMSLPTKREPSFRVVQASGSDAGMDISNLFVGAAQVGEGYRWRDNGKPFLNYILYRAADTKMTWNAHVRRGATQGALNAATYWTYAGHSAKDATGKFVMVAGLKPIVGKTQQGHRGGSVQTITLTAGAVAYHDVVEGVQPFVKEIGPGADLPNILAFAQTYERNEKLRWGIEDESAKSASADPESGAARYISRQTRREFAEAVRPLFERADLEAIRLSAAHARLAGIGDAPSEGYSIEYARIAESPDELRVRREQIEWEEKRGLASEVEAYCRLHPGVTRDQAREHLVAAALERAELQRQIAVALQARGLPVPATPAPAGDTPPTP